MTGRDFVAGAMENTTATLHQEGAQQDARELMDGNNWKSTIAHELFHQWFGDYVTTESWSNITVNESFANYSETLWSEYKYGKDAGDENMADKIIGDFAKMAMSQDKFQTLDTLSIYLAAVNNPEKVKRGIDEIVKFRDGVPANYRTQTDPFLNGMVLKGILNKKDKEAKSTTGNVSLKELVEYIKSKLPDEDKKGF